MNRHERRKQRATRDPRLDGMEIRYEGRTLEVKVYVNTDADPHEIAYRVREAVRGPKKDMAMVMVGDVPKEQAEPLWAAMFRVAEDTVKHEGQA